MVYAIFLLLYSMYISIDKVSSCLSNQGTCSVATYRYNPACRSQLDSGSSSYHGSYNGFLGAHVRARAYSERGSLSDYARKDAELHCLSALNCTWQNTVEDDLDWVLGEGYVDPTKLALITGSQSLPGSFDQSFLILASDPRPSHQNGQLVSLAIGCQQSTGILSFRFWRSRARTLGSEPKLDICTRKVLEVNLENCMTVVPTDNHTIIASIPPVMEPFVIVLKGYNFENEPEGGLILLDEIEYFAELDQPESCVAKNLEGMDLESFHKTEGADEKSRHEGNTKSITDDEHVISGDTPDFRAESHLLSREVKQQAAPTLVNASSSLNELILLDKSAENDCQSLQCLMDQQNAPCDYKRSGTGASGEGYLVGWRITSAKKNVANKLSGIHASPEPSKDSSFLVANFMGFSRTKSEDRFVLEAPEFTISDAPGAYLSFRKFLSTKGLYLSVCEDGYATRCFWNVYENSIRPFAREWTKEVVLLPGQLTTFYIVAWQNTSTVMNVGQVGITEIGLFSDSQAITPLC
ncbi:MAM domain-containing protein [Caenorhabditis elegans]|uniref:MAM domain-containing protein n=1 Tax=Caenorhabditis elegans TaxID=6239 RepID=Q21696_CAEEL|nr:MAM domain-containing protein [Caenorhabditis elegans]CCD72286.1 MAM domain-containing protein [Caenorhabditis elegans]|eukprot:NP_508447.3 Uncharacterized protein CELE_R04B3.1 [Caenorhabditis elegans]